MTTKPIAAPFYDTSVLFGVIPLYVIEIDQDAKLLSARYHPDQDISEAAQWNEGTYLNVLYQDNPLFIHFLNKSLSGQKISSVIKLVDHVFEIYFSPKASESGKRKGVTIFLKKVHNLRRKNFESQALQEELNLLRTKIENGSENESEDLKEALVKVQDHLKQSEKMASLGMNLASIAHEIKNPVGFIVNSLTGLKASFEELMESVSENEGTRELKEEIQYLLGDIEEGAIRTGQIAKSLGIISRNEGEKEESNINDLLKSTLIVLKHKTKYRIEVETNYEKHLNTIKCYPGKLSQVFMNIITNAVQAIPEQEKNGKIQIATRNLKEGVQIMIRDNGVGMSKKVKENLFKPLFTTKTKDEGTGLGMSISKEILDLHDGKIDIVSEEGKGTTFTITLS